MVHQRLRQRSAALFGASIRKAWETAKMSVEEAATAVNIPATLLKGLESGAKEPTLGESFVVATRISDLSFVVAAKAAVC